MGELIEQVEFRAIAPSAKLTGLDQALTKLQAMGVALDGLNQRLAGLTSHAAFRRTPAGITEAIKDLEKLRGKGATLKDISQVLGFDPKDVREYYTREQERLTQTIAASERKRATLRGAAHAKERKSMLEEEKKLQTQLTGLNRTFEGQTQKSSGAASAGRFFYGYQRAALREAKEPLDMLRAMFPGESQVSGLKSPVVGPAGAAAMPTSATVGAGPIPLTVPASQIVATLGPGAITLNAGANVAPATNGATNGKANGASTAGATIPAGPAGPAGSGPVLEEKETRTSKRRLLQRKELVAAGETVDTFFKEVNGAFEEQKTVLTTSPVKKARAKLERQVAAVKQELEEALKAEGGAAPGSTKSARVAALYRKQAEMMRSFVGKEEVNPQTGEKEWKASAAAKHLQDLGQGAVVTRTRTAADKLERRAVELEAKAIEQQQQEMVSQFQERARLRKELDAARRRGDKEEEKRLSEERRALEADIKGRNRMLAARQKSDEKAGANAAKVQERDLKQQQAAAYKSASYQAADLQLQDFLASGGRVKSETRANQIRPGSPRSVVAERALPNGDIERITVSYGKAEAAVQRFTKAQSEARGEGGYLAGDFVKNTAKVTLWAASVGVLYKSIELASHSIRELVAIGPQVGRLEQVFRGVGGSARQLTEDVLGLAAAYGADTRQAMEAAIQWSRLGLTRVQVNEAVRVSLMAANVAQMDALEATEALQGVMQSYGLSVGQLRGELGQIVQISNTYNVTNRDMLTGLTKVAAVAKQAGLPLAELQGLLGATIGGTAQSGANIGNMMKSVILALSNPELQEKLRLQFKFEPTTGGEEIKGMSQMLADVFVKFNHLNQLQRQSFLFSTAGRTQASRLEAMLEGYVKAQYLAVNAQLHLNTAEQENEKIVGALKTQLSGLVAEWERFVFIQGNRGPVQAMTEMGTALRNVLKLMNTPAGSWATTGIMGLLTAGGIKSVMAGMSLRNGDTFLGRSGAQMRGAISGLNQSMLTVYAQAMGGGLATDLRTRQTGIVGGNQNGVAGRMYAWSEAMLRVGRSSAVGSAAVRGMATAMGTVTRALGAGLIALRSWIGPLAVVGLAIYGLNRAMEQIGLSSETAEKKLAGLNEEAQKAAAAANAYAEAAQALQTIGRSLTPEKGFQGIEPDAAQRYVEQASQLVGLYEPDLGKQEAMQRAFKAQTAELQRQGDMRGVVNLLEAEGAKYAQKRFEALQKQAVAIEGERRRLTAEVQRLEEKQNSRIWGNIGYGSRQKSIDEKKRQLSELDTEKVRNLGEQTDAFEQQFAYTEKWQTELKSQKLLWESIAEVYRSVNANNPMARHQLMISALEAENEAITRHIQLLEKQDASDTEGMAARDLKVKELSKRARTLDVEMGKIANFLPNDAADRPERIAQERDEIVPPEWMERPSEEIEKRRKERAQIEQQMQTAGREPGTEYGQRLRMLSEERQRQRANREEVTSMQRNMPLIEMQTRAQFGREEAQREVVPFDVGRDETAKLLNRRKAIEEKLKALAGGQGGEGPQTVDILSRELELQNQKYEAQIALRSRALGVERDITQLIIDQRKEMEHSLLGAGPAEMLRKLAALRMGANGRMGIGQFLSLSPEMRREVAMVDTRFDPRMMDLQRERRRQTAGEPEQFTRGQMEISNAIAALGQRLKGLIPETHHEAYAAAAANVDKLSTSANTAAANIDAMSAAVERFLKAHGFDGESGNGRTATTGAGLAPRNPQAGGYGGGTGVGG